jgi:hypothetical protein
VLKELVGDKSLDRFRIEYEKVFRALRKTHGGAAFPGPARSIAARPRAKEPAVHMTELSRSRVCCAGPCARPRAM